jgi:hypothetical protein
MATVTILIISKFNRLSQTILNIIMRNKIKDINIVDASYKEIRDLILQDSKYNIRKVPAFIISHDDSTIEIYEGNDAITYINQLTSPSNEPRDNPEESDMTFSPEQLEGTKLKFDDNKINLGLNADTLPKDMTGGGDNVSSKGKKGGDLMRIAREEMARREQDLQQNNGAGTQNRS